MLASDYHECTVLDFDFSGNDLEIRVLKEPEGILKTTIVFSGVENVIVDGKISSEDLGMKYPDGEILSISEDSSNVSIYIIWNDYKTRRSLTTSYEFKCRTIVKDCCRSDDVPAE